MTVSICLQSKKHNESSTELNLFMNYVIKHGAFTNSQSLNLNSQSNESCWMWWMLISALIPQPCQPEMYTFCSVFFHRLQKIFVLNSTSSVFMFTSRMTLYHSAHLYRKLNSIKTDTLGNKFQIVLNPFYLLSTMHELCEHHLDGVVYLCWINCHRLPFASSFLISFRFTYYFFLFLVLHFECLFFNELEMDVIQHPLGYYV